MSAVRDDDGGSGARAVAELRAAEDSRDVSAEPGWSGGLRAEPAPRWDGTAGGGDAGRATRLARPASGHDSSLDRTPRPSESDGAQMPREISWIVFSLCLTGAAAAQAPTPAAPPVPDSLAFAALEWREIGPHRGGRSVAVAGSAARSNEYYMGTTGGGVFKTTDGGLSWAAVTDKYFGGTIGAIAISESNPDVVYVGTGEYPIRGNVSHGDGLYKTTDGGKTWRYSGLAETRQIARVRVHPKNPDVVYVAALGHVWAPNPERGFYRSADGGATWKQILFRNDSTGAIELVMDPAEPSTLYAGFWQAGRKPWQLVSGGAGSGIFKSTDGGEKWIELTSKPGLSKELIGNVGLAVSPAKPSIVWALIESDSGGVFRSGDGGQSWQRVNSERKLRQRAWYYTRIYADPKDTNTIYVSNVDFQRSTDGGRTFIS